MRIIYVILFLLLQACGTAPEKPTGPHLTQAEINTRAGEDITLGVEKKAVVRLWEVAESARKSGEYSRANGLLEQAIRMSPEQPVLWSRVAELQLLLKQPIIAENYAAKANLLSQNFPALRYRNWMIIKYAREMRSDTKGAEQAQIQLDTIRALEGS